MLLAAVLSTALAATPAEGTPGRGPRLPAQPVYLVDARVDGAIMAGSALTIAIPALLAS